MKYPPDDPIPLGNPASTGGDYMPLRAMKILSQHDYYGTFIYSGSDAKDSMVSAHKYNPKQTFP